MGASGAGAFQDGAGLDWFCGVFADRGEAAVIAALDKVMAVEPGVVLDYDTGAAGRVAAEIVAVVHGHPPQDLEPGTKGEILTRAGSLRRKEDLPARALDTLARVCSDTSELNEFWMEDGDAGAEWQTAMTDLTARLNRARGM